MLRIAMIVALLALGMSSHAAAQRRAPDRGEARAAGRDDARRGGVRTPAGRIPRDAGGLAGAGEGAAAGEAIGGAGGAMAGAYIGADIGYDAWQAPQPAPLRAQDRLPPARETNVGGASVVTTAVGAPSGPPPATNQRRSPRRRAR